MSRHEFFQKIIYENLLLQCRVIVQKGSDGPPEHGVLAHQDFSMSPEGEPDLLELLRANVVCPHDEEPTVLVEQSVDFGEVVRFPLRFVQLNHSET